MRFATLSFLLLAFAATGCDSGDGNPIECENTSVEVEIEEVAPGSGAARADASDIVRINYSGQLADGTEFDSAQNATFNLQTAISGFREGVAGMKIGGSRRITIPPYRGYGTRAQTRIVDGEEQDIIPSCSVLVFEVDLLDIES